MSELCDGQRNGRKAVVLLGTMFNSLYQKIDMDADGIQMIADELVRVMPEFEIPTDGRTECAVVCDECEQPPSLTYDHAENLAQIACTSFCKNQVGLSILDPSVPLEEIFTQKPSGQQG